MCKDTVIEKIKKLSALAEKAGTEAEAQNALGKIQLLLAKHNLSMKDVSKSSMFRLETLQYACQPSALSIANQIAKLYFCKAFVQTSRAYQGKNLVIVGDKENVETVLEVTEMVIHVMKTLATQYGQQNKSEHISAKTLSSSFIKGFANKIAQRIDELIEQSKTQTVEAESTGKELVLISDAYTNSEQKIAEYFAAKGITIKQANPTYIRGNASAFYAGHNGANNVSLTNNRKIS